MVHIIDQACNNQLFDDVLFTPHPSIVSRAQTPATRSVHGRPASDQTYDAWSGGKRRGLSLGAHTEHRGSKRHTSNPSTCRFINSYSLHVSEIKLEVEDNPQISHPTSVTVLSTSKAYARKSPGFPHWASLSLLSLVRESAKTTLLTVLYYPITSSGTGTAVD